MYSLYATFCFIWWPIKKLHRWILQKRETVERMGNFSRVTPPSLQCMKSSDGCLGWSVKMKTAQQSQTSQIRWRKKSQWLERWAWLQSWYISPPGLFCEEHTGMESNTWREKAESTYQTVKCSFSYISLSIWWSLSFLMASITIFVLVSSWRNQNKGLQCRMLQTPLLHQLWAAPATFFNMFSVLFVYASKATENQKVLNG